MPSRPVHSETDPSKQSGDEIPHTSFASFKSLPLISSTPPHPSNSVMSAAAAAALIIQAATSGNAANGANEDNTPDPRAALRRCSTTSLIDSPQPSPPFSMLSAAARLAAARAIGTPNPSPAAVLSLALAGQSTTKKHEQYDQNCRAMSDFLNLSDRRNELFASNPTLASVIRRRSSVLPPSILDPSGSAVSNDDRRPSTVDPTFGHSQFVTALEALTPKLFDPQLNRSMTTDQQTGPAKSSAVSPPHHLSFSTSSSTYSQCFPEAVDRQVLMQSSSTKFTTARDLWTSAPAYDTCSYSSTYCDPAQRHPSSMLAQIDQKPPLDLIQVPSSEQGYAADKSMLCISSPPLSYSSLSDGATPRGPLSPTVMNGQSIGTDSSETTQSGCKISSRFPRAYDSLAEHGKKSNGTSSTTYLDDPNRKREQRLMKNREAARECRRKKKEYVKCLEARVNVLEIQNQRLIEELQKVKALCFSELCFGLNSSSEACAAAVLAAASAVPSPYTPTESACGASIGKRPFDHSAQAPTSSGPVSQCGMSSGVSRPQRLSRYPATSSVSKSSSYLPADSSIIHQQGSKTHSSYGLVSHNDDVPYDANPSRPASNCPKSESMFPRDPYGVNAPSSDSGVFRSHSYLSSSSITDRDLCPTQQSSCSNRFGSKSSEAEYSQDDLSCGITTRETPHPNSALFQHPHYAAKRGYHNLSLDKDTAHSTPAKSCRTKDINMGSTSSYSDVQVLTGKNLADP